MRRVLAGFQAPLETKAHSTTMTAIVCTPNYVLAAAPRCYRCDSLFFCADLRFCQ